MRAPHRITSLLILVALLAATHARARAGATPSSLYNLTGFAAAATTGGGEIPDTDPLYRRVATPLEFIAAILDANDPRPGAPAVRVIEITADLDFGALKNIPPIAPKHGGLTIYSPGGAALRGAALAIKDTAGIIIRNLRLDAPPEISAAASVWIDHCTMANAGCMHDTIKAGARDITISWCRLTGAGKTASPAAEPEARDAGPQPGSAKPGAAASITCHHLLIENIPEAPGLDAHCYNLYIDNTRVPADIPACHAHPGAGSPLLLEKSVYAGNACPAMPGCADNGILFLDTIRQIIAPGGAVATTRGGNTARAAGAVPYEYVTDDPTELSALLAAGAGAGVITWNDGSKYNWLKTTYATPAADRPPAIIVQPAAQTVPAGGTAIFTIAATGSPVLAYQWYKDNAPLDGETTGTLTLANIGARDAGNYHVVVSNDLDTVTSNAVALTLAPPRSPPTKTQVVFAPRP